MNDSKSFSRYGFLRSGWHFCFAVLTLWILTSEASGQTCTYSVRYPGLISGQGNAWTNPQYVTTPQGCALSVSGLPSWITINSGRRVKIFIGAASGCGGIAAPIVPFEGFETFPE